MRNLIDLFAACIAVIVVVQIAACVRLAIADYREQVARARVLAHRYQRARQLHDHSIASSRQAAQARAELIRELLREGQLRSQ